MKSGLKFLTLLFVCTLVAIGKTEVVIGLNILVIAAVGGCVILIKKYSDNHQKK